MPRADAELVTTHTALAALLPSEQTPTPFALASLFAEDLNQYAEIVAGPGGEPAGFMSRGDGRSFSERSRIALEQLGMSGDAIAHHEALATWFEHLRGFFKIEWSQAGDPLAACYYRRRPSIAEAMDRLAGWGVDTQARERMRHVAAVLEKKTIHFVAAAFRPGQPVRHKLYFSQLVSPDTQQVVTERIAAVFALFGASSERIERWRERHAACLPAYETTLFVSVSCSPDAQQTGLAQSFKIDYPSVPVSAAAAWLPEADRAQVIADATKLTTLTGTRSLTFLGVRFTAEPSDPSLKYYCDLPRRL